MTAAPLWAASLAKPVPAQAGMPKKSTNTPASGDAFWSIRMPTASLAASAFRMVRAKSFLSTRRLPESARRRSTRRVDEGIVERADDHVHGRREQGVGKGAELPVAQVRGGEEHAAAFADGVFEVLGAFTADPARQVVPANGRELGEGYQQARDGTEDAVDNLGAVRVRKGESEVAAGHPAQAGNRQIEQAGVGARQHVGQRQRRPFERFQSAQREAVLDSVP